MGVVGIVGWCVDRGVGSGVDNSYRIIFGIDDVSDLVYSYGLFCG